MRILKNALVADFKCVFYYYRIPRRINIYNPTVCRVNKKVVDKFKGNALQTSR